MKPAAKGISRVPRWARSLALAIEIRFGKGKAATSEPVRTEEEDAREPMLVMEEGDLLAAYRATGEVELSVESEAGDRVLKPWQDLESFTTQDVMRMENLVLYPMGVMEGNVRAINEAQRVAKLLKRAEAEMYLDWSRLPNYPTAHVAMKRVVVLTRGLRAA
jgi:hypothetical protein